MIRPLVAALLLHSLATGLCAETYRDWEKAVPSPRPISFQGWQAPTTDGSKFNEIAYSVFQSPLGHLFGHLDFSSYPPADFPLRVRVLYYRLREADRNREGNGFNPHVPDWTSPLKFVAPNATLGELIESREVIVPSAVEGSVPVWSIWAQDSQREYDGIFNPYTVLVEVASHDEALLSRKRLVEAVAGADNRNVTLARTNSGAEDYAKTLGELSTTDELPKEAAVYEGIKVLWLDEATLRDPAYPDSFWHNVFFAGTIVRGRDADVQELAQRLGLAPNQRVLQGGLWTIGEATNDLVDQIRSGQNPGRSFYANLTAAKNPFEKEVVLGKKRTRELRIFSIAFLVSFTVFEIAIIVGSIFVLQGGRRVFRWLLIPVSAILYTVAGLFVVRLVVDFRPETQIFREVDTVEGWPESSVRTEITRLAFNNDRTSFTAPPLADFSWSSIESGITPLIRVPGEAHATFSMRQHYGRFSTVQIGNTQLAESPCTVTADRHLTATRPLRGAWLWDGKVWRNLGPLEPGKAVAIDSAEIVIDPKDENDLGHPPTRYQNDAGLPDTVRAMIDTTYLKSLKGTNVGLLLAIDARAIPEQMEDAAVSEIHSQTLLVHQFQWTAPVVTTRP